MTPKIIMGIDPGTNVTGYGLLQVEGRTASCIVLGDIDLHRITDPYQKLRYIFDRISGLIDEYRPDEVALESPFFGKNIQSMLKLGRAQGVAMAAALSRGVPVAEYAPRKVKQTITGRGAATKLWPPRNDNSGAITVLSSAGTNRKRCAGSGMPLPYNARLAVLRNFPFSILHFPFAPCLAPAICTAFHNKKLPHPVGCGSGRVFLTC